jgi:hypothetical protein
MMSRDNEVSQNGPFGKADGANEERSSFITFKDSGRFGHLEWSDSGLRERFFTGRRGSGKSRYWSQQMQLAEAGNFFVIKQGIESVNVDDMRDIHRNIGDSASIESIWIELWMISIQFSIATNIINHEAIKEVLTAEEKRIYREILIQNLGYPVIPKSVVECLNALLHGASFSKSSIEHRITKAKMIPIRHYNQKICKHLPPICMGLDAIDITFRYAPAESCAMQCALLLLLNRLLSDPDYNNRLHIFITVRDVVFSKFLDHDQAEIYSNQTHWKMLGWNKEACLFFFEKKIGMLPRDMLKNPNSQNVFDKWLGVSSIWNPVREASEEISDFLLRHTRHLPREIVEIGNALCHAISSSSNVVDKNEIWNIIVKESYRIGDRAIEVMFDSIIALQGLYYENQNFREIYVANLKRGCKKFMESVGRERISKEMLKAGDLAFSSEIGDISQEISFSQHLWQHGLIGYEFEYQNVPKVTRFYQLIESSSVSNKHDLPYASYYILHASLLEDPKIIVEKCVPKID